MLLANVVLSLLVSAPPAKAAVGPEENVPRRAEPSARLPQFHDGASLHPVEGANPALPPTPPSLPEGLPPQSISPIPSSAPNEKSLDPAPEAEATEDLLGDLAEKLASPQGEAAGISVPSAALARAFDGLGRRPSFFAPLGIELGRRELSAMPGFKGLKYASHARLAAARYSVETKAKVVWLYKRYFPEFHRDFRVAIRFEKPSLESSNASHSKERGGTHKISFEGPRATFDNELDLVKPFEESKRKDGYRVQRKVDMLLTFFHEYAHGIFDEFAGRNSYDETAYYSLTEGFAVTMECLLIDKMTSEPERRTLGLTDQEVSDLRTFKTARLSSLRANKGHYAEGTFYFWHKIYKKQGEAGMLRFLETLKSRRLDHIPRKTLAYRLVQNNPELFAAYFAGPPSDPTRQGMETLSRHVSSYVSPRKSHKTHAILIDRINPLALRRLLRRALSGDDQELAGPVLRMAWLSPKAAEEIAEHARGVAHWRPKKLSAVLDRIIEGLGALPAEPPGRGGWLKQVLEQKAAEGRLSQRDLASALGIAQSRWAWLKGTVSRFLGFFWAGARR